MSIRLIASAAMTMALLVGTAVLSRPTTAADPVALKTVRPASERFSTSFPAWIIAQAHRMGLVTYGEFVSTPYRVGIEAGVDALPEMGRYELGVIPDELQKPLVEDPAGAAAIRRLGSPPDRAETRQPARRARHHDQRRI